MASQQKTTKFYFSSQVRKQFSNFLFKPLRCCFRSDKLVNCDDWKFCKDLFLNFRVIWSVNRPPWFCWDHFVCIHENNYSFPSRWIVALGIFIIYVCRCNKRRNFTNKRRSCFPKHNEEGDEIRFGRFYGICPLHKWKKVFNLVPMNSCVTFFSWGIKLH